MTILTFTVLIALGSFLAGVLGALTGLGGGVVVVPMLTLLFGVDIRYAIGASLVRVDDGITHVDGIAALLRYAPTDVPQPDASTHPSPAR